MLLLIRIHNHLTRSLILDFSFRESDLLNFTWRRTRSRLLDQAGKYFPIIVSRRRPASCLVNGRVPKKPRCRSISSLLTSLIITTRSRGQCRWCKGSLNIWPRSTLASGSRRFMITAGGGTSLEAEDVVLSAGRTRAGCCASFMSRNTERPCIYSESWPVTSGTKNDSNWQYGYDLRLQERWSISVPYFKLDVVGMGAVRRKNRR